MQNNVYREALGVLEDLLERYGQKPPEETLVEWSVDNLRDLRHKTGLSQRKFATFTKTIDPEGLGVHAQHIAMLESGAITNPSLKTMRMLAKCFGIGGWVVK